MNIQFCYGSGSPFAWYVWLVLEHKQLPYDLNLLSLQGGDLKDPAYLAINPRGKVPVLIDNEIIYRESISIVEYLEDRYPDISIFPSTPEGKARVRQLILEAYGYLYPPLRRLIEQTLMKGQGRTSAADSKVIEAAVDDIQTELEYFESITSGRYLNEVISAADFALYPLLALVERICEKRPQFGAALLIGPKLSVFKKQVERLPYFDKTYPPHWKG